MKTRTKTTLKKPGEPGGSYRFRRVDGGSDRRRRLSPAAGQLRGGGSGERAARHGGERAARAERGTTAQVARAKCGGAAQLIVGGGHCYEQQWAAAWDAWAAALLGKRERGRRGPAL